MTEKETSPWKLFLTMFQYDQEIVVIDIEDNLYWGRLREINYDHGFNLLRPNGKKTLMHWEDVRFVGQDGFPLIKLTGADGSPSIEKLDSKPVQEIIRTHQTLYRTRYVVGDPWLIEDTTAQLVNAGNYGDYHYENDTEELLLLEHKNGAKAQLFNIPHIYHVETECGQMVSAL